MAQDKKTSVFTWEGTNKRGVKVSGEISSMSATLVKAELRQQGIIPLKVKKKPKPLFGSGKKKITTADVAIFTRQLATMMNSGIPVVQSMEILARGSSNPALGDLIFDMRADIESGTSLSNALKKYPKQFDDLYTNLVDAGEQSGSLDSMLDRVATYREKTETLKGKIKKALFYPVAVIVIAVLITAGLLLFVVPQFQSVFEGFGAELPAPTQVVIAASEGLQKYWYIVIAAFLALGFAFNHLKRTSEKFRYKLDALILKLPVIGDILEKAAIARYARTLSTTFAAGLPLVEALQSVAGATGNLLFYDATMQIREDVSIGQQMHQAMSATNRFPQMAIQMVGIGEEAGSLEFMLSKVADFYEEEVDNAVEGLSSLLEPVIMVVLGVLIGGLVVAMYMPIFKLGQVV